MAKIVFKELTSNQNVLFPVSLSEKIAPNHPVRVVNSVVDALDIGCLLRAYKGRHQQLPSPYDAQSSVLCLPEQYLFLSQNRKSLAGKYLLHVVVR